MTLYKNQSCLYFRSSAHNCKNHLNNSIAPQGCFIYNTINTSCKQPCSVDLPESRFVRHINSPNRGDMLIDKHYDINQQPRRGDMLKDKHCGIKLIALLGAICKLCSCIYREFSCIYRECFRIYRKCFSNYRKCFSIY